MNTETKLKPFDLEAAMKGEPVVTRDGRTFIFGAYNKDAGDRHKVLGWIEGHGRGYSEDGMVTTIRTSDDDLFMAPKKVTKWVNVYKNEGGDIWSGNNINDSFEKAKQYASFDPQYIGTFPIEITLP